MVDGNRRPPNCLETEKTTVEIKVFRLQADKCVYGKHLKRERQSWAFHKSPT